MMKKNFCFHLYCFLLFLFSVLIFSCSKSNSVKAYNFSFDENGVHKVFTDSTYVVLTRIYGGPGPDPGQAIIIQAYSGSILYTLSVYNYNTWITTKIYNDSAYDYYLDANYQKSKTNIWDAGYFVHKIVAQGTKPFSFVITTLQDSLISGTFSGDMGFINDYALANNLHITNGKFTLKINYIRK